MMGSSICIFILITISIMVIDIKGVFSDTDDEHQSISSPMESAVFKLHELITQESALRLTLDKQIQDLRGLLYQLKSEQESIVPKVGSMIANITDNLSQNYLTEQSVNLKMNISNRELSAMIEGKMKEVEQTTTEMTANISRVQDRVSKNVQSLSPIYFSVSLKALSITTKKANEILLFDNVITNKGNGYIASNGTFVCPKEGAYLIAFGILNRRAKFIHLNLIINGYVAIRAYTHGNNEWESAEKVTICSLNKGDQVYIEVLEQGSKIYGEHYSSFAATYIDDL